MLQFETFLSYSGLECMSLRSVIDALFNLGEEGSDRDPLRNTYRFFIIDFIEFITGIFVKNYLKIFKVSELDHFTGFITGLVFALLFVMYCYLPATFFVKAWSLIALPLISNAFLAIIAAAKNAASKTELLRKSALMLIGLVIEITWYAAFCLSFSFGIILGFLLIIANVFLKLVVEAFIKTFFQFSHEEDFKLIEKMYGLEFLSICICFGAAVGSIFYSMVILIKGLINFVIKPILKVLLPVLEFLLTPVWMVLKPLYNVTIKRFVDRWVNYANNILDLLFDLLREEEPVNPFEVFSIGDSCQDYKQEIKTMYRALALCFHSDKSSELISLGCDQATSEKIIRMLNVAYERVNAPRTPNLARDSRQAIPDDQIIKIINLPDYKVTLYKVNNREAVKFSRVAEVQQQPNIPPQRASVGQTNNAQLADNTPRLVPGRALMTKMWNRLLGKKQTNNAQPADNTLRLAICAP